VIPDFPLEIHRTKVNPCRAQKIKNRNLSFLLFCLLIVHSSSAFFFVNIYLFLFVVLTIFRKK